MKQEIKKFEDKFKSEEISILKVSNIENLRKAPELLSKLAEENAFVEPTNETIEEAETRRKALKTGRTTIQNHVKEVKADLSKASKFIQSVGEELIQIVSIPEDLQETANQNYIQKADFEKAKETGTRSALENYLDTYSKQGKKPVFEKETLDLLSLITEKEAEEENRFEKFVQETRNNIFTCSSDELKQLISIMEEMSFDEFGSFADKAASERDNLLTTADNQIIIVEEKEKQAKELAELKLKQAEEEKRRNAEIEAAKRKQIEEDAIAAKEKNESNFEVLKDKFELIEMKLEKAESSAHISMLIEIYIKSIDAYQTDKAETEKTNLLNKLQSLKSEFLKKEKAIRENEELKQAEAEKAIREKAEIERKQIAKENEEIALMFSSLRIRISNCETIEDLELLKIEIADLDKNIIVYVSNNEYLEAKASELNSLLFQQIEIIGTKEIKKIEKTESEEMKSFVFESVFKTLSSDFFGDKEFDTDSIKGFYLSAIDSFFITKKEQEKGV